MTGRGPRISVLIRTRNIERHFVGLLKKLSFQTIQPSELVVVDNFSSYNDLAEMIDILEEAKTALFDSQMHVKIVPVTDEEFSYAFSANVGVYVSEHELVCITNGHCLPLSDRWLERGVAHFDSQDVAGVGGYTVPHRYGTVWEKLAFDWGWRRLNRLSKAYLRDDFFSTTNCILRRSLWEKYPFDEKMPEQIANAGKFGGEDFDWALEMLARGYRLVVEPEFDVYHSHGETISQLVPKYLTWQKVRRDTKSLSRPRESFTRLWMAKPLYYCL